MVMSRKTLFSTCNCFGIADRCKSLYSLQTDRSENRDFGGEINMDCSSILSNVIIGAIGSILATLIIFLLSLVYNSKAKEQRFFDLNYIQKEVWQIENHLGFPDDFDF